jgi:hypothetical protein
MRQTTGVMPLARSLGHKWVFNDRLKNGSYSLKVFDAKLKEIIGLANQMEEAGFKLIKIKRTKPSPWSKWNGPQYRIWYWPKTI